MIKKTKRKNIFLEVAISNEYTYFPKMMMITIFLEELISTKYEIFLFLWQ